MWSQSILSVSGAPSPRNRLQAQASASHLERELRTARSRLVCAASVPFPP